MSDSAIPTPHHLLIGQVLRPHGIRGELRLKVLTHYPERVATLETVLLGHDPEAPQAKRYGVERARLHQDYIILKLDGVDSRDAAELLREQFVMVSLEDAVPLEEGEYYFFQLIGLKMYSAEDDEYLGEVTEILETGANEVYIVQSPRYGEILVPAIPSVVQTIDLEAGRIIITPLPGLLPDLS